MNSTQIKKEIVLDEKPPILSSWKQLYSIVFGFLIFQVVIYYIFTKFFS